MKIIAKIPVRYSDPDLIIQCSAREYGIMVSGRNEARTPKVGTEVKLDKLFSRVRDIEAAQERLNRAAKELEAVATLLRAIDVVVPAVVDAQPEGDKSNE